MIVKYPNYKRSLLNISQSILKAYGLNTEYPSIVEIDRVFKRLTKARDVYSFRWARR